MRSTELDGVAHTFAVEVDAGAALVVCRKLDRTDWGGHGLDGRLVAQHLRIMEVLWPLVVDERLVLVPHTGGSNLPAVRAIATELRITAYATVPIVAAGVLVGFVSALSWRRRTWSEKAVARAAAPARKEMEAFADCDPTPLSTRVQLM